MKIIKLILLIQIICCSLNSYAQDLTDFYPRFDDESNRMIVDTKSVCNIGKEPFFKFLCKFREDDLFRQQRTELTGKSMFGLIAINEEDLSDNEFFEIFEEQWILIDEDGEPEYYPLTASWFDVSGDRVCYAKGVTCEDMSIEIDFVYIFERIDDKWYLVAYLGPEE